MCHHYLTYLFRFGLPTLFITITTNPKWREIVANLQPGQTACDRPDIVARVFAEKQSRFVGLLTKKSVFGQCNSLVWNQEYQKRLLQHSHNVAWIEGHTPTPETVDKMVCAELPVDDPVLLQLVLKHHIHGPCGTLNPSSPCMKNGKCSKDYPKQFQESTIIPENSYPLYRRRSGIVAEKVVTRNGITTTISVDNRWVVPFNKWLLRQLQCHVNVEVCSSVKVCKYTLKYTNKGTDRAVFNLNNETTDEISDYQNSKYLGSNEAATHILGLKTGGLQPPVERLSLHLPDQQNVIYTVDSSQPSPPTPRTKLTAYFEICSVDAFAKTLKYHEIPEYYLFQSSSKSWCRRKRGGPKISLSDGTFVIHAKTVARLYAVSPKLEELFYLRLLLVTIPGPTSFAYLKTVNDVICSTFKIACSRLGLLDDDVHLINAMTEIAAAQSSSKLRKLFVTIACCCNPINLKVIWNMFEESLCEDHVRRERINRWDFNFTLSDEIRANVLTEINRSILSLGGQPLSSHGINVPTPIVENSSMIQNERRNFDIAQESTLLSQQLPSLNEQQLSIFNEVVSSIQNNIARCFFISSSAGSGKSYLLNTIISHERSNDRIVLATAASACASLVLRGASTMHSRFKVPIVIHSESTCNISRGSELSNLILTASLIIIDECTMLHRHTFEALDRTLRDLTRIDALYGGKTLVFSGDFKQCLPIIPGASRSRIVDASLRFSRLWQAMALCHLTTSMRHSCHIWTDYLEEVGKGSINDENDNVELKHVSLHRDLNSIIERIYPDISICSVPREVAILAPLNTTVDKINNEIINLMPGETHTYLSVDSSITETDMGNFPTEFLNKQESGSLPPHKLILKKGAPVIVIRNINPPHLVNGTRGVVIQLYQNVVEIENSDGTSFFLPRITIVPSDNSNNFIFKRRQFPIKLAFAMTINRAQGQTLQKTGLDLTTPCFSHGQLYVGISRTPVPDNIHVLLPPGTSIKTHNPVYKETLS